MKHHLVILRATPLRRILEGPKTVECRLSRVRRPPFGVVQVGDRLWLKRSGGPVVGTATVSNVEFVHPIGPEALTDLYRRHGTPAQADRAFFTGDPHVRFATFIHLTRVHSIEPVRVQKLDRRAWVVLPGPLITYQRRRPRTLQSRARITVAHSPSRSLLPDARHAPK